MPDAAWPRDQSRTDELARLSHRLIVTHQHSSGAYPAAPTFSAYRGFSWFRDGAFIADGMSRYGDDESAGRFHDWCSGVLSARRDRISALTADAAAGRTPPGSDMLPTRFTLEGADGAVPWWDHQLDGYGTWLWALVANADRHDLDLGRWAEGVELAVAYLAAFWDQPCYDWWEESPDQVHVSTLGSIAGGLRAAAGSGLLDSRRADAARGVVDQIDALVRRDGVAEGHLTKWLGSREVDASLLACVTPFALAPSGSTLGIGTVHAVREQLVVDGGTHRYLADVFYGGGQWPLLTCLLGWNLLEAGDLAGAQECLTWAAAQADADGNLPEQVDHDLLAPGHRQEWLDRWGPVATPLLWSHGMFLALACELEASRAQGPPDVPREHAAASLTTPVRSTRKDA